MIIRKRKRQGKPSCIKCNQLCHTLYEMRQNLIASKLQLRVTLKRGGAKGVRCHSSCCCCSCCCCCCCCCCSSSSSCFALLIAAQTLPTPSSRSLGGGGGGSLDENQWTNRMCQGASKQTNNHTCAHENTHVNTHIKQHTHQWFASICHQPTGFGAGDGREGGPGTTSRDTCECHVTCAK